MSGLEFLESFFEIRGEDVSDPEAVSAACPSRSIRVFPNGTDHVDTTADALLADIEEELDLLE